MVLIVDEKPQRTWRLVRVLQLFAARDGKKCVATPLVGGNSYVLRPVCGLAPLEVVDLNVN